MPTVKTIEMTLDEFKCLVKPTYEESCFLAGLVLYQFIEPGNKVKLLGRVSPAFFEEVTNCPDIEWLDNENMHLFFKLKKPKNPS